MLNTTSGTKIPKTSYIYIQILRPKPNSAHPWTDPTPHNCARNILKTRLIVWASQCAWPAPHRPALGRRLRAQDGKSNRAAASSANQTVFKSFSRLWKYFLTAKIRYKWNSATKNSSARKFVDAEALKEIIKHVTTILTCEENTPSFQALWALEGFLSLFSILLKLCAFTPKRTC